MDFVQGLCISRLFFLFFLNKVCEHLIFVQYCIYIRVHGLLYQEDLCSLLVAVQDWSVFTRLLCLHAVCVQFTHCLQVLGCVSHRASKRRHSAEVRGQRIGEEDGEADSAFWKPL